MSLDKTVEVIGNTALDAMFTPHRFLEAVLEVVSNMGDANNVHYSIT